MRFHRTIVFHSSRGRAVPGFVREIARERRLDVLVPGCIEEIHPVVNQHLPACIVLDGSGAGAVIELCRSLKADPFTAIIPVAFHLTDAEAGLVFAGLEAGADEVLTDRMDEREHRLRMQMTLDRADRDVSVHPSTRLPGTVQIERDMVERMRRREHFAVCYADLDHFKEFNDRYGYNEGDSVILILSRILRDVVKGLSPSGFIGHIGGDDFIFTVPLADMRACCETIIEIFDELIPYQYSEADRQAGYYLGKDRRGNVHKIPLMTVSIGVVTNKHRRFVHTARISELATEMKSYAKSIPGSVYAVDRRRDAPGVVPAGGQAGSVDDSLEATGEA